MWGVHELSSSARGYGAAHRRARERWARVVEAGEAVCCRCSKPIRPGGDFHLDHDDHDRSVYLGVSHPKCNQRAAAAKANATKRRRRRYVFDAPPGLRHSRQW